MYAIIEGGSKGCATSIQATNKSKYCPANESSDAPHMSGDAHDNQKFDNAHVRCMSMEVKILPHFAHLKCVSYLADMLMELTPWSIHLIIYANYPCYLLTESMKKENEQIGLGVESIWSTFGLPSNGSVLDTNHWIINLRELLDERRKKVKAVRLSDHVSRAAKGPPTANSVTRTHEITVPELSRGKIFPNLTISHVPLFRLGNMRMADAPLRPQSAH